MLATKGIASDDVIIQTLLPRSFAMSTGAPGAVNAGIFSAAATAAVACATPLTLDGDELAEEDPDELLLHDEAASVTASVSAVKAGATHPCIREPLPIRLVSSILDLHSGVMFRAFMYPIDS